MIRVESVPTTNNCINDLCLHNAHSDKEKVYDEDLDDVPELGI